MNALSITWRHSLTCSVSSLHIPIAQTMSKCTFSHLCLFSYAKDWYKCIEKNSIIKWAQVKTSFLERFYPTNQTKDWRKKIASFTQENDESLNAKWNRFKRMIRACPHHEYGKNHLNTIFYDGLNGSTKALLDSPVHGQLSKIKEIAKNSSWGGARGVDYLEAWLTKVT